LNNEKSEEVEQRRKKRKTNKKLLKKTKNFRQVITDKEKVKTEFREWSKKKKLI
jgi:hypothetical protein